MSRLTLRVTELIGVLYGILHCLRAYNGSLGTAYATKLESLLEDFHRSVVMDCDRELAKSKFASIKKLMHSVNGAATKGEHDFFPADSDLLNHYWALESVFSESEFSKQPLTYNWQQDKRDEGC